MNQLAVEILRERHDFERRMFKGLVPDSERNDMVARIAFVLPSLNDEDDKEEFAITDLLCMMEWAGDKAPLYKELIASYLNGPSYYLAWVVLTTLCDFYDLPTEYAPQISDLMRGVSWDHEQEVQDAALWAASAFLRKEAEPLLLRTMIEMFEDSTLAQEVHEAMLNSLKVSLGLIPQGELTRSQLNAAVGPTKVVPDANEVLRLAKERLKREEATINS